MRRENFRLQFDPSEIPNLAKRYDGQNDTEVLHAGQRIAQGDYSRENLGTIFQWKTKGRGASDRALWQWSSEKSKASRRADK